MWLFYRRKKERERESTFDEKHYPCARFNYKVLFPFFLTHDTRAPLQDETEN